MEGMMEGWLSQGGGTANERYWEEAGGDGEHSGLGHGAGLLLIDVAAHAAGVDAWKAEVQRRGGQRDQRSKDRPQTSCLLWITG